VKIVHDETRNVLLEAYHDNDNENHTVFFAGRHAVCSRTEGSRANFPEKVTANIASRAVSAYILNILCNP
jgi:hypothetical protein